MGTDLRMALAADKRARRAEKRIRDALSTEIGQLAARERLEGRAWVR